MKNKGLVVSIPEEMHARLKALAEEQGMTMTNIVKELLEALFEKLDNTTENE